MKLLRVEMDGFLSYTQGSVDLEDLSYCAIVGPNGAGKSTMFQAVTWALYGTTRVSGDSDSVVNDEAEDAIVKLDVQDVNGTVWRIIRTRRYRGAGTVRLYRQDGTEWVQFAELNAPNQEQIYEIVGLSEDAFYSLVFMDQSSTAGGTRFTRAKSPERRAILLGLLPELDVWGEFEDTARDFLKAVRGDMDGIVREQESLAGRVERNQARQAELAEQGGKLDRSDLEAELATVEDKLERLTGQAGSSAAERAATLAEINAAKADHQLRIRTLEAAVDAAAGELEERLAAVQAADNAAKDVAELQVELRETEEQLVEAQVEQERAEGDVQRLQGTVDRQQEKRASVDKRLAAAETTVNDLTKRLDGLDQQDNSGHCWVCDSELSDQKCDELIHGLEGELADAKSAERDAARALKAVDVKIDQAHTDLKAARQDARRLDSKISKLTADMRHCKNDQDEAQADLESAQADLAQMSTEAELSARLEEARTAVVQADAQFEDTVHATLQAKLAQLDKAGQSNLTGQLERLRQDRKEIQADLNTLSGVEGAAAETKAALKTLKREAREATARHKQLAEREARLQWLVEATSAKGVPSMLLDSVLSAIEDRQNAILESLPGSTAMRVEFRQERNLRSREGSRSVLDIIVHTGDGYERAIESFSFGERVRLTISNLFAMVQVVNERTGGRIRSLFLDEPLGPLDAESVPAFIEVLRAAMAQGVVDSIFVVTHDQRVIEALPQQLVVTKSEDGGSQTQALL